MLSQLPWQKEPHCGLDLPGGDGGPLVVVGEAASLGSNTLEEVVDERVHNGNRICEHFFGSIQLITPL